MAAFWLRVRIRVEPILRSSRIVWSHGLELRRSVSSSRNAALPKRRENLADAHRQPALANRDSTDMCDQPISRYRDARPAVSRLVASGRPTSSRLGPADDYIFRAVFACVAGSVVRLTNPVLPMETTQWIPYRKKSSQ